MSSSLSAGEAGAPQVIPSIEIAVELIAAATGFRSRRVAVCDHAGCRNVVFCHELLDQSIHRSHLQGRRHGVHEVSDKADSDAQFIVFVTGGFAGVGAMFLHFPSRSDLDQAIPCSATIVDHKVIPHTVPSLAPMDSVEQGHISLRSGRVVNHDMLPLSRPTRGCISRSIARVPFRRLGCRITHQTRMPLLPLGPLLAQARVRPAVCDIALVPEPKHASLTPLGSTPDAHCQSGN
jgi:hypothetical protein